MRNYIIKRVAQSVLILFCVMFIIYALIRSLPSSFAETMAMQLAQAPGAKPYEEWLAQLNASYGLDLDIVPGFFTWLSKAVVGNFGDSWKWNVPATQKFTEVIGLSVIMGGISFVLSIVIAVPLGVLAATKQYSRTDYVITAAALVGISLPTFFFATLLKLLFSVKLGWFDLYGLVGRDYAQLDSPGGSSCDKANHLVLPIVNAGHRLHRRLYALHPHEHAGSAERRLHPHRPRQGPVGAYGHLQARLPQHADSRWSRSSAAACPACSAVPLSPRRCSPSRASATSLTSPWSQATSRSRCSTCPSWRC